VKNRRLTVVVLLLALSFVLALSGCDALRTDTEIFSTGGSLERPDTANDSGVSDDEAGESTAPLQNVSITENVKDIDTDSSWDTDVTARIALNGASATVDGSGAEAAGGAVTITTAGTFVFSGTLSKGQIVVSAGENDKVRLVLNGVDITAEQNAAIYAKTADKVVLILADGKKNVIADSASYVAMDKTSDEPNAAIFADCDLSINGTGSLAVDANFKHGIATKDDLIVASGDISVNSVEAGLRGKDSITILDGAYALISDQGDAIKTANDTETDKGWILVKGGIFTINSRHDGISAATAMQIDGGTFTVTAGGEYADISSDGESFKGIKGGSDILISDGTFTIASYDDAVHSNTNITIAGGDFNLQSQDDGIHADETLTIGGGEINIPECYEGIEASTIDITGGNIVVVSSDDALNAAGGNDGNDAVGPSGRDPFGGGSGTVNISGGTVKALASSDCIDSNGTLDISGGTVYTLSNAIRDGDALDISGEVTFTGGTVVYGGLLHTGINPSGESTQSYVYANAEIPDGTKISVKQGGETLTEFTSYAELLVFAISSPEIVSGQSYEIYRNGALIVTATAGSGGSSMGGGRGMGGNDGRGRRDAGDSTPLGTAVGDEIFSGTGVAS
jgi:hypothetical protein